MIDPEIFDTRTRSVLVNSLYFKADWLERFELIFTQKESFYKSAKEVIQVDSLHNRPGQIFSYYECPHMNAKLLKLPFKGNTASLVIVLPNEKDGLANLENNLDMVFSPHNFSKHIVDVSIPKFKIESKIDLKPILKNLGVKKIFDDDLADLSEIAGEPGDLIVDEVVQKTFIDVSEKRVEAAAATFVVVPVPSSAFFNLKTFNADHPFLFYVEVKEAIIFAGRVANPAQ